MSAIVPFALMIISKITAPLHAILSSGLGIDRLRFLDESGWKNVPAHSQRCSTFPYGLGVRCRLRRRTSHEASYR
jgi:hypothetical protein